MDFEILRFHPMQSHAYTSSPEVLKLKNIFKKTSQNYSR